MRLFGPTALATAVQTHQSQVRNSALSLIIITYSLALLLLQ